MRNDIVIFKGPSISSADAEKYLNAIYLPPAKQGDMYKAFRKYQPKAIGLIDGNFECTPAPWHKEILYLISQGVKVFGASSMGALRAAELDVFGMIGIGEIYCSYAEQFIEDDDEVAILHAPQELDYQPLSDAMVDIRLTLNKAMLENIISSKLHDDLIEFYKKLFYKQRLYTAGVEYFKTTHPDEMQIFELWLDNNKTEQKREDAILLLKTIELYNAFFNCDFEFQNTVYWHNLKFTIDKNVSKST